MDRPHCLHSALNVDSGHYATATAQTGYRRPTEQQRVSATKSHLQGTKSKVKDKVASPSTFPSPLVLPGDDLFIDPKYPTQSLRQWLRDDDRNVVTPDKNVVYIAAPPEFDEQVDFMRTWTSPTPSGSSKANISPPKITDVVDYLTAYYHGISVKVLPSPALKFSSWDSGASNRKAKPKSQKNPPRYVGLDTSTESVRVRTRASKDGIYTRQLNLDDLLDAAIGILPENAYALLLLVDHDLFESPEDDFVCGRAYGGSRVAVISSARYNPILDSTQGIDRDHAWPASHCEAYIKARHAAASPPPAKKRAKAHKDVEISSYSPIIRDGDISPLHGALSAHKSCPSLVESLTSATLNGLWLGRVCRTAAHELGHCFGMDHCVYYACSMQGSASLTEDASQPPYLCPVDLEKLLSATGANIFKRYESIQVFCLKHKHVHLFEAYRAWIDGRLRELRN